jgi:hypothetical protein
MGVSLRHTCDVVDDGVANAWYDSEVHSVTVCYEYLDELLRYAHKETTAAGVTHDDAIVGPTVEVLRSRYC